MTKGIGIDVSCLSGEEEEILANAFPTAYITTTNVDDDCLACGFVPEKEFELGVNLTPESKADIRIQEILKECVIEDEC